MIVLTNRITGERKKTVYLCHHTQTHTLTHEIKQMCGSTQKLKDITYNGRFVYFNIKVYPGGWYLERQHDQHKGKGH